jgi:hypothetical protein
MTANYPWPRISETVKGYQHPRTIAEMLPVREAEIAAHAHEEHTCPEHGPMPPRPLAQQTYEQLWCGVWYDCAAFRGNQQCGSTQVIHSRDLAYEHGEPYDTGHGWEKFTPAGWVAITDEEAGAYWAARQAYHQEQERQRSAKGKRARRSRKAGAR